MTTEAIATMVEARTGLTFHGHQRARMSAAVLTGARRHAGGDLAVYAALLATDEAILGQLVDALVVRESYFFRDAAQMELLRHVILSDLARRTAETIDVWSAGCANGEEAYSLSVLAGDAGLGHRVRILGTDVSGAAVDAARAGAYGPWSRRGMSDELTRRCLVGDGPTRLIAPTARQRVSFQVRNLLDGPPKRFHLVLCRNLLMYLGPAALDRAARILLDALRPGGWLVTGASDPVLVTDGLTRVRTEHGLAYRRIRATPSRHRLGRDGATRARARREPPTGSAACSAASAPGAPPVAPGDGGIPERSATDPSPIAARSDDPSTEAVGAPSGSPPPAPAPAPAGDSTALLPAGPLDEAMDRVQRALQQQPLDAQLRYLAAVLHLDAGRARDADREARAALYLDPELTVAHLIQGHARRALGRLEAAAGSYRRAADGFARRPADELVVGGAGHSASGLSALAGRLAASGVDDGR